MKKRIFALLLAAALLSMPGQGALGAFTDVGEGDWFYSEVMRVHERGLFQGRGGGLFAPHSGLKVCEAVCLTAALHSLHTGGGAPFSGEGVWYAPYYEYAGENGLFTAPGSAPEALVTRAELAQMIYSALPEAARPPVGEVSPGGIPDVTGGEPYGAAVYALYRAGILTGGEYGVFRPNAPVTRGEAAAILARADDPALRRAAVLPGAIPGEALYARLRDAVFFIEVYDAEGERIGKGSGFFIDAAGTAVTNYHVIEHGVSAVITAADGRRHPVSGVYAYDTEVDLAILQIEGADWATLPVADSSLVPAGAVAYTFGSPNELQGSMTRGVVSNPGRLFQDLPWIQFTAPIAPGSGGGPLVNALGQVVGVVCLVFTSGQNLNLAVPSNAIAALGRGELISLAQMTEIEDEKTAAAWAAFWESGGDPALMPD